MVTYELLPQTGTSARTLGFVRALVRRGHDVLVVGPIKDSAREESIVESLGSSYVGALPIACKPGIPRSLVLTSNLIPALKRIRSRFDFEILHFANYNMNALTFPFIRQSIKVPIVSDLHATVSRDLESGFQSQSLIPWLANVAYEKFMLRFSDSVITPTAELEQFFGRRFDGSVFSVFNCVRLPGSQVNTNARKKNWVVFFHANFHLGRSVRELARLNEIVKSVCRRGFKLSLLVAGPGSTIIGNLGPTVRGLGYVEDVYRYLSQSDIVILPVQDASLGLHSRLVESMATWRPVVASREACCGLLSYLQESGIEVCGSLNQMVESVCLLLGDPDRLAKMGERNGLLARRLFSPETVGKSLENAYEQTLRGYSQRC
jgi:glycosyltransferase involved in cell wall biosynthesis